jgi:hypothetical protein
MAATTYTTTNPITLAQLAPAYRVIAVLFEHLAAVKEQQGVNIIVTALVLNPGPTPPANTVSITFSNALPVNAEQLLHLGIA